MMTDLADLSDSELLRLALAGEENAFLELYRRHYGAIYRFALQMSGSQSLAEDIVQEVFLTIVKDDLNFEPSRGSLSAYLYGIARNRMRRHLDRAKYLVPIGESGEGEQELIDALIASDDPLGDLTHQEGLTTLSQAILSLPLHYREVVALCDLEELSYAEAAGIVGCAVGTIRSRLHRSHALLAEKLRGANGRAKKRLGVRRCFA